MLSFNNEKIKSRIRGFSLLIYSCMAVIIAFVIYKTVENDLENSEIDKNLATTEAVVYKVESGKHKKRNRGMTFFYKFEVNGKSYYNSAYVGKTDISCFQKGGCIGLKLKVEYSSIDPIHSRLVIGVDRIYGQTGSTKIL